MSRIPVTLEQHPALSIVVFGDPAPQGSKKFLGMTKGKDGRRPHAILAEDVGRVKPWRQDVVAAARAAVNGAAPLDGSLVVRMVFTVPKPASAPKRRTSWPNKRPDVSKLCRSTEDALVTAGAITDDARIVGYDRLFKVYPNEDPEALGSPGVRIEIRRLEELTPQVQQRQLEVA
jgi:Holliday junction resolvase RusA-like endonuclease